MVERAVSYGDDMCKVRLILMWQGRLPEWTPQWVDACNAIPGWEWVLVCPGEDRRETFRLGNVRAEGFRTDSIDGLLRERLGVALPWKTARDRRKSCEIRPAYGVLFEDMLTGCDWWGWFDLDVVFGRVRQFATDELLGASDLITIDPPGVLSGPLTLMRNIPTTVNLFRQQEDWRHIFEDECYHNFDERGIGKLVRGAGLRVSCNREWQGHDHEPGHHPVPRLQRRPDGGLWDEAKDREVALFHFSRTKSWPIRGNQQ